LLDYPAAQAEPVWDAFAPHLVGRHRRAQATGNRHVHDFDHPNGCDLIDAAPFDS